MLGRHTERRVVDQLLDAARAGASGAVVVRGQAGIGKSTLLDYAVERADGFRIVRTHGYESESEIPFAGLSDLLRPLLGSIDHVPPPQAAALAGALAVGPPAGGDRFTVCAATLSLLAAAAESQPLLAIVDDAHWVDAASLEALLFAARRVEAEGIALLFATREDSADVDFRGVQRVDLAGLDRDAAKALTDAVVPSGSLSEAAFEHLYDATGGNPLALRELPPLLGAPELRLGLPADEPVAPGQALQEALLRRVRGLPAATRRALLVVAAGRSDALALVMAALERLRIDLGAFEPAERAGMVVVNGERVAFSHPLLRSVTYHDATLADRLAVHRALADAAVLLPGDEGADLRAWHRAAATLTPDGDVAEAMEEAGARARSRHAYAAAARCQERAATLTPAGPDRPRRLLKAAKWWQLAGLVGRTGRLLDEALDHDPPPVLRAEIQHLRGYVQMWRSTPPVAQSLLVDEAARVEDVDPGRAALILADAAIPGFMLGELRGALAVAERAERIARRADETAQLVTAVVLAVACATQRRRPEAITLLDRWMDRLEAAPALARAQELALAATALGWLEREDDAERLFRRLADAARRAGALGVLPYALGGVTDIEYRSGHWDRAYAHASESIRLAAETGQANAYALIFAAQVEAARGEERECRGHIAAALAAAEANGIGCAPTYAGAVLGLLDLGLGRTDDAIAELEAVGDLAERQDVLEPNLVQWAPNLAEAYIRAGRVDDARSTMARFAPAADSDECWVRAVLARCEGLLAGADFEDRFEEALEWHNRAGQPFERARTQLCLGERLRRERRRSDARPWLSAALETFERLGAAPWSQRALAELRATGVTARRRDPSTAQQLTPQELQVALVVAGGATNAEAAATLFLSPKTVEYHLSNVYRKLGKPSRNQLADILGAGVEAATAAAG